MKISLSRRLQTLMLPGLKRYILIILVGIVIIVYGVFLLLGLHPLYETGKFIHELTQDAAHVLPYRISGIIVLTLGGLIIFLAMTKVMKFVLKAYISEDRESIPDVLYKKRHLERGARVVVIGGGTGLSNLLRGLKSFTNNITAIVTVGDDGGSSGRLREELGVLPPGDLRNCITALADEEKLVTELFRYRFESGQGLEGHSFGNLFLAAVWAITKNDVLEAVRVASRVLNSCGEVLPATLSPLVLVAELEDGRVIRGESHITEAGGQIKRLSCEPTSPKATPEALEAIAKAELIVLGPGSLYTSVIPNLLIEGLPDALRQSSARKIYVCNVMTQKGETMDYSMSDHVRAILQHSGGTRGFVDAVLFNDQIPVIPSDSPYGDAKPVAYDPDRLRGLGIYPVRRPLLSDNLAGHHDPDKLAQTIMLWFYSRRRRKQPRKPQSKIAAL